MFSVISVFCQGLLPMYIETHPVFSLKTCLLIFISITLSNLPVMSIVILNTSKMSKTHHQKMQCEYRLQTERLSVYEVE